MVIKLFLHRIRSKARPDLHSNALSKGLMDRVSYSDCIVLICPLTNTTSFAPSQNELCDSTGHKPTP
jgi:hypothetical protein